MAKNVVSADVKFKKGVAVLRSREEVDNGDIVALVSEAGFSVSAIE